MNKDISLELVYRECLQKGNFADYIPISTHQLPLAIKRMQDKKQQKKWKLFNFFRGIK